MKKYSGNTTFDFEIERYRDKETGNYYLVSDVPDRSDDNFEFEYETITLEVSGSSYFVPGKISGPPEDCYPDEGDTEIESVIGPDGKDWYDRLSSSEINSIMSALAENVENSDYDDYDGSDDDRYDDYYDPSWDNYDPYKGF